MATKYDGTESEQRALDAFIRLTRAYATVDGHVRPTFAAHDLTSGQFGVLEALHHLGPMHQGALGEKLLQSKGNISTIISNLEERDLVRRRRDPDDRRYVKVHLTADGETLIQEVFPEHVRQIQRVFGVLKNEEIEELSRLCKKLGLANSSDEG